MFNEKSKSFVTPSEGRLFEHHDLSTPISTNEPSFISTADGNNSRIVIAINGQFPGPQITAHENQTLVIHVRNLMDADTTTIHFHGMHQKGTTYSDGVAFVSQCPIEQNQTFTYTFKAKPHGTNFYRAHSSQQRSMGLYGPLIVQPKQELPSTTIEELVAVLQDWNHDDDYATLYQSNPMFVFHSGLVNGKGRYYQDSDTHNQAPLTQFEVIRNEWYTFRVISAATFFPFLVYVTGHRNLTLTASDGYAIKEIVVNAFIINPGERYDFKIFTNQPNDNYMFVARTLEKDQFHVAEAIIHYRNAVVNLNPDKPASLSCSTEMKCKIFNCPYLSSTNGDEECLTYNDAQTNDFNSKPEEVATIDHEYFFNFAFPNSSNAIPHASVNGRRFEIPTAPLYSQPDELNSSCNILCPTDFADNNLCSCTYTQEIENGKVYQFTLTNLGNGKGWSHPVHLHGHSFYVMKMGFGKFDSNGVLVDLTTDISCEIGSKGYCNRPVWANTTSKGGNIPGIVLNNNAQKDTIIVPSGGYVVTRFKADNPGAWFFHCDIGVHSENGMGMVIIESPEKYPDIPNDFPVCENSLNKAGLSPSLDWMLYWITVTGIISKLVLM
ncbi:laccase-2-like [Pecten maximus]|uniref:laccase-2-like n=1 Tax=Pecten maximus TaxID=6579 RepID=UPI00145833E0|nr:laccase-2-like [Pecten maximus]